MLALPGPLGRGVEPLMNIAGGYQDSQFEGGVGRVTDAPLEL